MLTTLRIKNLALVADLTLELRPGYNVITGETGAGKSILIGALNLTLGERADRTKEFISHRTDFTVNIALIYKSIPIMGVIYAPAWDTLYFAAEEVGSYRLDKASSLIKEHLTMDDLIITSTKLPYINTDTYTYVVSRSHINMKTRRYLRKNKGEKVFISKGSSLKLCAIAEGSAHEYPRFGRTMEWDIAAGDAIIRNAGAKVRIEGSSDLLTYNKADLANPEFIASR